MCFFYIKPDKTKDFEAVLTRLTEVLAKTPDPAAFFRALSGAPERQRAAVLSRLRSLANLAICPPSLRWGVAKR